MSTAVNVYDGSLERVGNVRYWTGSAETEASVELVPYGRPVAALGSGFVIAHRCGSADWAEHSMRGATESVVRGVSGLEISVARSSDGVFFGLHDDTLNRTTPGLAANYKPGEHTWAEISALLCKAGADTTYPAQPYARLVDLLEHYVDSHAIFIDPKVMGGANFPALLDLMDSYPNARDRFVGKYYCTGTAWADQCRARGYTTWGYAYASDLDAGTVTPELAARWDYLGMEWSAAASYWSQILAFGQPVIAHIAPTLAAAQQGMDNGAVGVMASGIRDVMSGDLQ